MQCGGFNSDSYDLYSLGLLEDEESAQIGAHLQEKCQTCSHALGESRKLWYSFGTAQAAASSGDLAVRMTRGLADNWATGMRRVLPLASLNIGGVAISSVVLSDRSQYQP